MLLLPVRYITRYQVPVTLYYFTVERRPYHLHGTRYIISYTGRLPVILTVASSTLDNKLIILKVP